MEFVLRNNLHLSQFEFDTQHLDGYQDDTHQDAPRKHGRFVREVTFFPSDFDLSRRPGGGQTTSSRVTYETFHPSQFELTRQDDGSQINPENLE